MSRIYTESSVLPWTQTGVSGLIGVAAGQLVDLAGGDIQEVSRDSSSIILRFKDTALYFRLNAGSSSFQYLAVGGGTLVNGSFSECYSQGITFDSSGTTYYSREVQCLYRNLDDAFVYVGFRNPSYTSTYTGAMCSLFSIENESLMHCYYAIADSWTNSTSGYVMRTATGVRGSARSNLSYILAPSPDECQRQMAHLRGERFWQPILNYGSARGFAGRVQFHGNTNKTLYRLCDEYGTAPVTPGLVYLVDGQPMRALSNELWAFF